MTQRSMTLPGRVSIGGTVDLVQSRCEARREVKNDRFRDGSQGTLRNDDAPYRNSVPKPSMCRNRHLTFLDRGSVHATSCAMRGAARETR